MRGTPEDLVRAAHAMGVTEPRLLDAVRSIPRAEYVPRTRWHPRTGIRPFRSPTGR
jgi:hypothetical protein